MILEELVAVLNRMDLHINRDDRGRYWTIPNKDKTVVQIIRGGLIKGGIALRITDKYSSLYTIEEGLEEIRYRIQIMFNNINYDKARDRNKV